MEPLDVTVRRLLHEERTQSLSRSARRDRSWFERRLGLLLIAAGRRLAAERAPLAARAYNQLDQVGDV